MSKGTKNYFRHSFYTHEDIKIQKYLDVVGPKGYLFFFTLIEVAAHQCVSEDKSPAGFYAKIHPANLSSLWRCKRNKLRTFLEHSQNILGMIVEYSDNEVSYHIPNLFKYLGKYDSNSDKLKKRKENKIKEKIVPEKLRKVVIENIKKEPKQKPATMLTDDQIKNLEATIGQDYLQKQYDLFSKDYVTSELVSLKAWLMAKVGTNKVGTAKGIKNRLASWLISYNKWENWKNKHMTVDEQVVNLCKEATLRAIANGSYIPQEGDEI